MKSPYQELLKHCPICDKTFATIRQREKHKCNLRTRRSKRLPKKFRKRRTDAPKMMRLGRVLNPTVGVPGTRYPGHGWAGKGQR